MSNTNEYGISVSNKRAFITAIMPAETRKRHNVITGAYSPDGMVYGTGLFIPYKIGTPLLLWLKAGIVPDGAPAKIILDLPAEPTKASSSWAALIKQVYEVDPLTCPRCGAQMKIIAFIHRSREIEKICQSLDLVSWRAPPPLASSSEPHIVPIITA